MNHEQHGDFVEIAVQDTGIGIRVEDLPKLFQESIPLDALLGRRFRGTGLGLALTKKLVELHGGQIWAKSTGEGQGSTFVILLPVNGPGDANKR
jgi:signal transduction histidine kinase